MFSAALTADHRSSRWAYKGDTGLDSWGGACTDSSMPTQMINAKKENCHYETMMTRHEKYLSLHRPSQCLKPGITLQKLNAFAAEVSDNEAAEHMNAVQDKHFNQLHGPLRLRA